MLRPDDEGAEPAGPRDVDVPEGRGSSARRLVPLGRGCIPQGEGTRPADPPGHRGHVVPLVSRDRPRIVRGSGPRRGHQRPLRRNQGGPGRATGHRRAVPAGRRRDRGPRRLAAHRVPHPGREGVLRRHVFSPEGLAWTAELPTRPPRDGRRLSHEEGVVNEAMLKESLDSLRGQFDPVNGGISGQQKFPHPGTLEWVMARHHRTREESLQKIFTRTLSAMAKGGVYDQIGGGFHRYSTDPRWIVPHFEKMLYDNAGLLANYVHAWQLTRDPLYRDTAEGILAWAEEVLSDRQRGGYFASQDADVGLDDDGDYFTWTSDELKAAVTADEARVLALHFEVGDRGEMHHNPKKNVLFVDQDPRRLPRSSTSRPIACGL